MAISPLKIPGRTILCLLLSSLDGIQAMKGGDAGSEMLLLDTDPIFVQELWVEDLRSTL